ncbi:xanthine dehydrogenase family protein molybdopterin-binding subunit [Variovorax sp. YR216]|uniref:xanthine dehydrogenase family protein molybdopterin-binding subunit n=1 Tax=Variovorax sp. YR216 TaxID=1882828 RepID=UPI00089B0C52|nr:xanthine dehydrogenase family protein molybdopterin-binding subunit [Variovorax sp. YR216]SEB01417.1 xanthine dehydrogenase, molybdenum binding subunit apoprotein [Variovorax sp. YR216]
MSAAVVDIPGGVGQAIPQLESDEKLTGRAQYIADLYRPGMLHGAILQSPYAHARIRGYDLREALALPGVRAIVTGDDLDDAHKMGAFIKDEPAFAKGKVRYVGEIVAAVAADTEAIARQATRLIRVDYEELPAVLGPEEALAPGAALVHEDTGSYVKVFDSGTDGNLCSRTSFRSGDIDSAWAQCDVVVEGHYQTQAQAHLSLEPCGALAEADAAGRVTLWSANQSVFRVQASVCESLGLPMTRLRCLTPRIGAGFGNKMEAHVQPAVVLLALKTRKPVKLIMSREEDFEAVRARHPVTIRMKTGVKRDGTIVARETELLLDGGAFGDDSPGVLGYALLMNCGPYRIPNVHAHGRVAYTNKLRFGAFRGFGVPQVTFASETQLDEVAHKLGMDPIALRRKNMLVDGDPWFGGQPILSNGLAECLDIVQKESGWPSPSESPPGRHRGFGVALTAHISGLLASGAIVRVLEDGSVLLNTGAVDIGQGSNTVLTQMCAEALKLPVDRVAIASPDTDGSPYNWGTTASRVTYVAGRSVVGASEEVADKLKQQASEMLECAVEDLELLPGGKVAIKGVEQRAVSFAEISGRAHWAAGGPIIGTHSWVFNQKTVDPKRAVVQGLPFPQIGIYSFGALVVEVEVDELTGKVRVVRAWSACDIGRAINPTMATGQIEGAFVQGMGYALTEEMVWDGARLANPSLMDYKIPTFAELPESLKAYLVESNEPSGPFGAKSVGEIGINGVAAAIANGIAHATGARLHQLPLSSERVLNALLAQDGEGAAS